MPVDTDLVVRKMRDSDINAVVALESEIFPDAWPAESFRESVNGPDGGGLVVETRNGTSKKLIAYACYYSAAGETHLTNIAVAPDHRRQGIANRILESLYEKAKAAGSDALFLEVRASNETAMKLYASHGFQELYRRKNYYHDPREDAVVFVREFSNGAKRSDAGETANSPETQSRDIQ